MSDAAPPSPTDAEVLAALHAAGARGLLVHGRAQPDLDAYGHDAASVSELVASCEVHQIKKHELDYEYPTRNDYIAVLKMPVGEPSPFYVKVALRLPKMSAGVILSFKPWT